MNYKFKIGDIVCYKRDYEEFGNLINDGYLKWLD